MSPLDSEVSATAHEGLPHVLNLSVSAEISLVGGKAARLAQATAAGFRVPPGVVVTSDGLKHGEASYRTLLESKLAALGAGPFAVRSSAAFEDSSEHSFAGQLETVLHVPHDGVFSAIKRVQASASALRVLRYRSQVGAIAVLLQPMLEATEAGVAFSADPHTGERSVVLLEAVSGVAESLVSGAVNPEAWRCTKDNCERTRELEKAVLSVEKAQEVARLARAVEALFGVPQDIEWAFVGEMLYLLQARPITALPAIPVEIPFEKPEGNWERDDHHGVLSPLGWDWFQPYPKAMAVSMREIGVPVQEVNIQRFAGNLYLQMVMPGGDGPMPPKWVLWLVSRALPSMRRANRTCVDLLENDGYLRVIDQWENELRPKLQRKFDALWTATPEALSNEALLARIEDVLAFSAEGLTIHAQLGGPPAMGLGLLMLFLENELHWPSHRVFELVVGSSTKTTEVHRKIRAVVQEHLSELGEQAFLATWGALFDRCPKMADALANWLQEQRLHMLHYDPKHSTLGEQPELVLSIAEGIVEELRAKTAVETQEKNTAIEDARAALSSERFAEFERLVANARRAYASRDENGVWTVSLPAGLLRYYVLELGRRIEGTIGAKEHAVYLYVNEHRRALEGRIPGLAALIERRRGEESWALKHRGPKRFGAAPPAMNDFSAFPSGLATMMKIFTWLMASEQVPEQQEEGNVLRGVGIGSRVVVANARVIERPEELSQLRHGEVLVCRITSPEGGIALGRAGALVTNEGGLLSHPAIIAREYGISAVLGADGATQRLRTGARVRVDPVAGTVTVL